MSDPLSLMREATMAGTTVSYADNHYSFGSYKFHESTKTSFKRTLRGKYKCMVHMYGLRDEGSNRSSLHRLHCCDCGDY